MESTAPVPLSRTAARSQSRLAATVSFALRLLGTLCLSAAIGVSGYMVWLLWGTGLGTQQAQNQLRGSITSQLDSNPAWKGPQATAHVFPPGGAVAIIRIPRIKLDMVVVEGTDRISLQKGPGHYANTAYPWQDHGRVAIAGHRTTYLHPFWSLDKLKPGDRVELDTKYGDFHYEVTRVFVIDPSETWVLNQTKQPTLVLTTCNPRFSAAQRLIVFAKRF